MNLHTLKATPGARHAPKRVGRGEGSGHGKTSGRGTKGYHSRAGSGYRPTFEGGQMPLFRRLPKRGFTQPNAVVYRGVNVAALEAFAAGTEVGPEQLRAAGLACGPEARRIKILGVGTLTRKLSVKAHAFSASARAKIEAAGGTCEVLAR